MEASERLMFNPRVRYQQLRDDPPVAAAAILWLRRPAFVALILGCGIALMTSAQLSFGLVLSTSVCWSFVPIAELIALLLIGGRAPAGMSRSQLVDLFFVGHTPWLLWIAILGLMAAFMPTLDLLAIFMPWLLASGLIALLWSLWIDFHFFRIACGAGRAGALCKLALQRLVSWTLIVAVFSYGSLWPSVLEVTAQ